MKGKSRCQDRFPGLADWGRVLRSDIARSRSDIFSAATTFPAIDRAHINSRTISPLFSPPLKSDTLIAPSCSVLERSLTQQNLYLF